MHVIYKLFIFFFGFFAKLTYAFLVFNKVTGKKTLAAWEITYSGSYHLGHCLLEIPNTMLSVQYLKQNARISSDNVLPTKASLNSSIC